MGGWGGNVLENVLLRIHIILLKDVFAASDTGLFDDVMYQHKCRAE